MQLRTVTGGQHHNHGLANGAAESQQKCADNARQGSRQHHLTDGFGAGCAQPQRTVTQRLRHSGDDVVRQRGNKGNNHQAHYHPGSQGAGGPYLDAQQLAGGGKEGADGNQGKYPVDDGRDAGQNLDHRLGRVAKPGRSILGHVDGSHQSQRDCHQHGDDADHKGAPQQRQQSVFAVGGAGAAEGRIPLGAKEKVGWRNESEEVEGFADHRQHNADGGENGRGRAQQQQAAHHALDMMARLEAGADALECQHQSGGTDQCDERGFGHGCIRLELGQLQGGLLFDGANLAGQTLAGAQCFDAAHKYDPGGFLRPAQGLGPGGQDDGTDNYRLQQAPEKQQQHGGYGAADGQPGGVINRARMHAAAIAVIAQALAAQQAGL